jgi:hypothetical protein
MDVTQNGNMNTGNKFMLEFKGLYRKREQTDPVSVLVQFDGNVLHIWHQADPFYRITTCSDFSISTNQTKSIGRIKLNNGDAIETNDLQVLKLLHEKTHSFKKMTLFKFFRMRDTFIAAVLVILFFGVWLLTRNFLR